MVLIITTPNLTPNLTPNQYVVILSGEIQRFQIMPLPYSLLMDVRLASGDQLKNDTTTETRGWCLKIYSIINGYFDSIGLMVSRLFFSPYKRD